MPNIKSLINSVSYLFINVPPALQICTYGTTIIIDKRSTLLLKVQQWYNNNNN